MTTELKPCRVCNRPAPEVVVTGNGFGNRDGWAMTCDCGVRVKRPSEAAVESVWNTLMSQPDVPVAVAVPEIEKLRQEVAQLQGELEVSDTLHDKYVRAAITGIMAHYGTKETPDYVIGEARDVADAAMKARKT